MRPRRSGHSSLLEGGRLSVSDIVIRSLADVIAAAAAVKFVAVVVTPGMAVIISAFDAAWIASIQPQYMTPTPTQSKKMALTDNAASVVLEQKRKTRGNFRGVMASYPQKNVRFQRIPPNQP